MQTIKITSLLPALLIVASFSVSAQKRAILDTITPARGWAAGISAGINVAGNDFTREGLHYHLEPVFSGFVENSFGDNFGIQGSIYGGAFGTNILDYTGEVFVYQAIFTGILVSPFVRINNIGFWRLSPFVQLNVGLLGKKTTLSSSHAAALDDWKLIPTIGFSFGFAWPISATMDMRFILASHFTNTDELDGRISGSNHDGYSTAALGLSWRLGGTRGPSVAAPDADRMPATPRVAPPGSPADGKSPYPPLNSSLAVSPFASIRQLQANPEKVVLRVRNASQESQDATITFRLLKDSATVASSVRTIRFHQAEELVDAAKLIDFDKITVRPGYDTGLSKGKYVVAITIQRPGIREAQSAFAEFRLADVTPAFGANTPGVEQMIERGEAEIASSDSSGVLKLGTFAVPNPQSQAQPDREKAMSEAADSAASSGRHPSSDYAITREPMSVIPPDLPANERQAYIKGKVTSAFKRAQKLLQMAREAGNTRSIPDVVISMVFFEYGQTALSDEARMTLEAVAQELVSHPSFVADIRGYADEVGDETYNLALSKQRSEKVAEHLTRNHVSQFRLSPLPLGKIDNLNARPDRTQQYNRRVEIVLTGVREN